MQRLFFFTGALLAGLAVAMGAATGHETSSLSESGRVWIEKAVRYQFYHALAILGVAMALAIWPGAQKMLSIAGYCFTAGILCFSGSLYFMAFTGISAGYITPLGGIFFLAGWLVMMLTGLNLTPPR